IKLISVLKPRRHAKRTNPNDIVKVASLDEMKQALEELAQRLAHRFKDLNISVEALAGDPKKSILKVAGQWKADLIVMGTTNKRGIDKILLGSVSQAVLQSAPCPVLIVKEGANSAHIKHGQDFSRILIASDNSPSSRAACAWLSRQGWSDNAIFKIMTALPTGNQSFQKERDTQKAAWLLRQWSAVKGQALKTLEKEAALIGRGVGNEHVSLEVMPGEPKAQVLSLAKLWRAELIVTGCHEKTGLEKILAGRISQSVASNSPCSVLVVKGLDEDGNPLSDKKKAQMAHNKKEKDKPAVVPAPGPQDDNNTGRHSR
ncbi:MAG: universal stress protein, partial [Candidatus Obscuribacterales bacterium]|nr:universal stress protein [Candidatus Obscuribacterales bacterium]